MGEKAALSDYPKPSMIRSDADVPDLVRDPQSRVVVSDGGRDRGPIVGHGRKARLVHAEVERADVQYEQDKTRHTVTRIVDTLTSMHNKGSISDALWSCGRRFQNDFDLAHFESLPSMRFDNMPPSGQVSSEAHRPQNVIDARTRVFGALTAMGGLDSSGGIALWWILGMRWSLRDLASRQEVSGDVNRHAVWTGALTCALGVLDSYYAEVDRLGRPRTNFSKRA